MNKSLASSLVSFLCLLIVALLLVEIDRRYSFVAAFYTMYKLFDYLSEQFDKRERKP